jgi:hypothetical protein
MKKLIGLTGGKDATYFEVLDVKNTVIKTYPSIKNGKALSALEVVLNPELYKYKKEISTPGHYATVAGNAVSAEAAIMEALGDGYKAFAVSPTCVEIWAIADYNEQVRRACNVRQV